MVTSTNTNVLPGASLFSQMFYNVTHPGINIEEGDIVVSVPCFQCTDLLFAKQ